MQDPADGTLPCCGWGSQGRGVRRRNRSPDQVSVLVDSGYAAGRRMVVDPDGFVAVETMLGLVRLAPGDPAGAVAYSDPSVPSTWPAALALVEDGHYLATEYTWGTGPRRPARIDRATGAFTEVADLAVTVYRRASATGDTAEKGHRACVTPRGGPRPRAVPGLRCRVAPKQLKLRDA